jgi:DnaJ-class molecular chaperone
VQRSIGFASFSRVSACDRCRGRGKVYDKTCRECRGEGRVTVRERFRVKAEMPDPGRREDTRRKFGVF